MHLVGFTIRIRIQYVSLKHGIQTQMYNTCFANESLHFTRTLGITVTYNYQNKPKINEKRLCLRMLLGKRRISMLSISVKNCKKYSLHGLGKVRL